MATYCVRVCTSLPNEMEKKSQPKFFCKTFFLFLKLAVTFLEFLKGYRKKQNLKKSFAEIAARRRTTSSSHFVMQ